MVNATVDKPHNHREATRNVLVRDGFRCVVTGRYDTYTTIFISELQKHVKAEKGKNLDTRCTYILPETIATNTSSARDESESPLLAILERFGYHRLATNLRDGGVYNLQNVLTLEGNAHQFFHTSVLWFEATAMPDTYTIHTADDSMYMQPELKTTVTFKTPDPTKFPRPSRENLEIHTACTRVAWLSGAGLYIDTIMADLKFSAEDDSDASEVPLERALLTLKPNYES
ncbi:hypothetical protein BDQ12DRAFT_402679 [Crucibulum laeve]|uniref:HNH nuclease domain-containing protein n=1 Tax=Crucibulum laeve TaxID=68775 RepID=A0A5C3LLY0_9AGAR|nr:hypothetical protein BDQ12DRAFT_402679 [Crucibulum laeve]